MLTKVRSHTHNSGVCTAKAAADWFAGTFHFPNTESCTKSLEKIYTKPTDSNRLLKVIQWVIYAQTENKDLPPAAVLL